MRGGFTEEKVLRGLAASGWRLVASVRSQRYGWTHYVTHPQQANRWLTVAAARAEHRKTKREKAGGFV